jgi:outer membrane protein
MRRASLSLYLVPLLLLLPLGAFADEAVSLKVGYLTLSPEGTFASTAPGINTKIDIENDLAMDDSEEVTAEAALQLGPFRLSLGYMPINFSGTSTVSASDPLRFEGQNFSGSVTGEMDIDLYDLGLTWYLVNFDDLPVRLQLGPELAIKVVDGTVSLASGTIREEVSGTVPVPTIGARARVGFGDFLALIGRAGYVSYSDNSFLDADAQVEFSPIPIVGVFGGYRYLDLEVDESDLFIDAQFSGPYAGAFVRF